MKLKDLKILKSLGVEEVLLDYDSAEELNEEIKELGFKLIVSEKLEYIPVRNEIPDLMSYKKATVQYVELLDIRIEVNSRHFTWN